RQAQEVEGGEEVGAPHRADHLGDPHCDPCIEALDRVAPRHLVGNFHRTPLQVVRDVGVRDVLVEAHGFALSPLARAYLGSLTNPNRIAWRTAWTRLETASFR